MPRHINPVTNNTGKAHTYKELMGKYSKAIKNECYFEAMLIVYAFLEDRLRSYLYYIGALKTTGSYKFDNAAIKNDIKRIVDNYSGENNPNLGISSISGKIRIVRSVNKWLAAGSDGADENGYLTELAACLDTTGDTDELLRTLDLIDEWRDYRNEVIHAVLNKNLDSLYTELGDRVQQGMEYGRTIDKQISAMKRRKSIRKYLGLRD